MMNLRPTGGAGRRLRSATLVVALALAAAACGSGSADETGTAPTEQAASADVVATVAGGQISVNDLEGTDTVLWFWAPW